MKRFRTLIVLFFLLLFTKGFGQTSRFDESVQALDRADSLLRLARFSETKELAHRLPASSIQNLVLAQAYNAQDVLDSAFYYLFQIDSLTLSKSLKPYYYEQLAKALDKNSEYDAAHTTFTRAQTLFEENGNTIRANRLNLDLYKAKTSITGDFEGSRDLLDELFKEARKLKDYSLMAEASLDYIYLNLDPDKQATVMHYFDEALSYNERTQDIEQKGRIYQLKGAYYGEFLGQLDSAIHYYELSDRMYAQVLPDNAYLFYSYVNRASVETSRNNEAGAIVYLEKADSIPLETHRLGAKKLLYNLLSNRHREAGNLERALYYLDLKAHYADSLSNEQQNINLVRFETERKEHENRLLQQKNTTNRRLLYASLLVLGIGLVAGIMIYKNIRRKQRIAEQDRLIEHQKVENLLKTQELNTLDAMLAGQEKERQRLAGELHDSVGASLTAVRIHFEHFAKTLSDKPQSTDYLKKTNSLLEDAYREVRSLAHAKNSGVIGKHGLLPAVKQLAKNVSGIKGLAVEVKDFGLEERLDNALEIAVFRMVQELVTNIVKHAKATEATISLTNHKDSLNIIVEDNGRGFDSRILNERQGMGLNNLERRVEHLHGTLEIDSSTNGTSIIVTVPLV